MVARLILVAFALTAGVSVAARGETLPEPFDTGTIKAYLATHPLASVDEFLAALPDSHQKNAVFVHTSNSLQDATRAAPRQILFGWDARMLVGVGGSGETVELAAFDPDTGLYRYSELSFESGRPVLDEHPAVCADCHGSPPRPIWHAYGQWPGVYGNETGGITAADSAGYDAFRSGMAASSRYRNLKLEMGAAYMRLLERVYPFPTTVVNFALGNTVSIGLYQRLKRSPAFARGKWALLGLNGALGCGPAIASEVDRLYADRLATDAAFGARYAASPAADATVRLFRLFGVDPGPELNLTEIAAAAAPVPGLWNAGGNALEDFVDLLLVDELDDAVIDGYMAAGQADTAKALAWIKATGRDRIPLENYPSASYAFYRIAAPDRAAMCQYLEHRYLGDR